jgi:ABC-type polysaccharide/polyol phosphate transport system ATPase subunit
VAIEVRELRKGFEIPIERQTTLKERALRPGRWLGGASRELQALRGISFDVHRGEFFGVVGRNGCGKSTLLKLLASIYRADGGTIRVAGRLAPFIELGVGFNPELSARDNVVLNGVMMGLSPGEARARFEAVIDYAELWDYTELKLKNYSSGMYVRLAFALMLQVDADILLVDEVLAVGDVAFQRKCKGSLEAMQRRGVTVVLVSHDMSAIERHCDRAMLLEDGEIALLGEPRDVAERYVEVLYAPRRPAEEEPQPAAGPRASVTSVRLTDEAGKPVEAVSQGEPITLNATVRAEDDLPGAELLVELINNPEGLRIASWVIGDDAELAPLRAGEEATVRIRLENPLAPGNYRFSYALGVRDGGEVRVLDRAGEPTRLTVLGTEVGRGIVRMEHRIAVDRRAGRRP